MHPEKKKGRALREREVARLSATPNPIHARVRRLGIKTRKL